ncbi:MAG: ribosome biogenesis GTP-binding protein YihA/YsxC [Bacteroidetes bacterium]|nr:ribosome biogenesis GTP-binding protein YihA/YsxC [Bacteroidota bacterium]
MIIETSAFICSSPNFKSCPDSDYPEFAFIGRSNVGKSSLINFLLNRKGLAKVSQQPGKTRMVNHFYVNNKWYLVDLPGYGYAKIPLKERERLETLIYQYLSKRKNLEHTFLLIDSRLNPQPADTRFMTWMVSHHNSFTILFTKSDKLTKNRLTQNLNNYKKILMEFNFYPERVIPVSVITRTGKDEILQTIESVLNS